MNKSEYYISKVVSLRTEGLSQTEIAERIGLFQPTIGGSSTAKGMREYLVLLSLYETLRLRNASFLKFLISGANDIDEFLKTAGKRAA
jgi:hypothetical protein